MTSLKQESNRNHSPFPMPDENRVSDLVGDEISFEKRGAINGVVASSNPPIELMRVDVRCY